MSDTQQRCIKKGCTRLVDEDSNYCKYHQQTPRIHVRHDSGDLGLVIGKMPYPAQKKIIKRKLQKITILKNKKVATT